MGYTEIITKYKDLLENYAKRDLFIVMPLSMGGVLLDLSRADEYSKCFNTLELNYLPDLLASDYLKSYLYPVVIDIKKALSIYVTLPQKTKECAATALELSRFSFMGTDGMRGKVSIDNCNDPVKSFINDGLITPEMIELTTYAFGKMIGKEVDSENSKWACVGNDGRDIVTKWSLNKSMIRGFNRSGFNVEDLGVVPTPFIPYRILLNSLYCGASLTASHNPANQNGIKFFNRGSKLLPEGIYGDYSFAGWVYKYYLEGIDGSGCFENIETDISKDAVLFLKSLFEEDFYSFLKSFHIVLDTANGAGHYIARELLDSLNVEYSCVNPKPSGANINKYCGVAEIEGNREFVASDYDSSLEIVKKIFDAGRSLNKKVLGIALDGDADRGFLLVYNKSLDRVVVFDGDKAGYLILKALISRNKAVKGSFITTVESDIMTAISAKENLKIDTPIVSVGDKWIGSYKEDNLLLGLESSGHLIYPLEVISKHGERLKLLSGNGLFTVLKTIEALFILNTDPENGVSLYEEGYSKTLYTYFVDKNLFYRGSRVWNLDKEILVNNIPKEFEVRFYEKEDRHMLYTILYIGNKVAGSIFCRNSGTEDKTAVYIKCRKEFKDILYPVCLKLGQNHIKYLKNKNSREFEIENSILEYARNRVDLNLLKDNLISMGYSPNDIDGVIYGLKKEERIILSKKIVSMGDNNE